MTWRPMWDYWTADGYLWWEKEARVVGSPCEGALVWYRDERDDMELGYIDLGGEA